MPSLQFRTLDCGERARFVSLSIEGGKILKLTAKAATISGWEELLSQEGGLLS